MSNFDAINAPNDGPATAEVEWNGRTFTVPATPGKMHPRVLRALEREKSTDAAEGILGAAQFEALMDDPAWSVDDMGGLIDKISKEVWGFEDAGE